MRVPIANRFDNSLLLFSFYFHVITARLYNAFSNSVIACRITRTRDRCLNRVEHLIKPHFRSDPSDNFSSDLSTLFPVSLWFARNFYSSLDRRLFNERRKHCSACSPYSSFYFASFGKVILFSLPSRESINFISILERELYWKLKNFKDKNKIHNKAREQE